FIFEIINHFLIKKYNQKFQESYSVIKQVNEDIKNQQNSQNINRPAYIIMYVCMFFFVYWESSVCR
ncbi:MAG: hypothetical protein Q8853_02950, partial [Candidatus Phytoplasma australasiaticum]|nr:hypothetical protein [Candidatus Phytoplasma australasiaticum]